MAADVDIVTAGPAATPAATRAGDRRLAVRVSGLRRAFGSHVVLDGVDLEIAEGEFVALLGRSGSGKSTLLRALGALDPDAEGDAAVPARRSVVFQEPRLLPRLLPWRKVLRNVMLGLPRGAEHRRRALAALEEVGLGAHAGAWPRTLSGGEAQRAALARALVREPQLLLLDEPFGALDALTRMRMHELLRDLYRRHLPAVLLVTHDVDEAIVLADRVIVLVDGRIAFDRHVDIVNPRVRTEPTFASLRAALLACLGVRSE